MATHGSVNNMIMGSNPALVPEVGMGATKIGWTDRQACTVIAVLGPNRCVIQEDNAKRVDNNGMSESQEYEFTPNPDGQSWEAKRSKNGQWYGPGGKKNGARFAVGYRSQYHDYSF